MTLAQLLKISVGRDPFFRPYNAGSATPCLTVLGYNLEASKFYNLPNETQLLGRLPSDFTVFVQKLGCLKVLNMRVLLLFFNNQKQNDLK